jgi:hypothetical protein
MLQWLYSYVARFYPQCFICFLDVCCKCVYLYDAYVSHMLQVFYLDVAYVCNVFLSVFYVFQMHISSVSSVFFMLHLDVLKVDRCCT